MWDLINASENLPFSVAITLMLAIALLEGVTTVFGAALSELVDTIVPDLDADLDIDTPDVDSGVPALSGFLGWLRVGQVPVLILFVVFLLSFGLGGFAVQSAMHGITGNYLGAGIASLPALAIALPSVHFFGGLLAAVLPRDETEAVAEESFIGRSAEIVLGSAQAGSPAQAKLRDDFGKTHYIMFEPLGDAVIAAGSIVTLTERHNGVFRGVPGDDDV